MRASDNYHGLSPEQVRQVVVHSDNAPLGPNPTFGGVDGTPITLLTQIHDNIRRSLLSNMHSIESDCPTRERVGCVGICLKCPLSSFHELQRRFVHV